MISPQISPAVPIQLLNTHLGGSACGPRGQRLTDGKCVVKSLQDFVARLCLSLATSSSASSPIRMSSEPLLGAVAAHR